MDESQALESGATAVDGPAQPPTPPLTPGEYKVGITFNPGNNPKVDELKRKAAGFIDAVEAIIPGNGSETTEQQFVEIFRLKALAITSAEVAAMWAVKAATKPA